MLVDFKYRRHISYTSDWDLADCGWCWWICPSSPCTSDWWVCSCSREVCSPHRWLSKQDKTIYTHRSRSLTDSSSSSFLLLYFHYQWALLVGKLPFCQTCLCRAHWYLARRVQWPPLQSPHLPHLWQKANSFSVPKHRELPIPGHNFWALNADSKCLWWLKLHSG